MTTTRGPFGKTEIKVAGVSVQIDVENDLVIDNVHLDIDKVSAQMGFWGDVHSSAEEEAIMADSHYRHWRANLAKTLAESDGKLAEWKVKNEIEAAKDYWRTHHFQSARLTDDQPHRHELASHVARYRPHRVLEFGCGFYSTKLYLDACEDVTSVEGDSDEWLDRMRAHYGTRPHWTTAAQTQPVISMTIILASSSIDDGLGDT